MNTIIYELLAGTASDTNSFSYYSGEHCRLEEEQGGMGEGSWKKLKKLEEEELISVSFSN